MSLLKRYKKFNEVLAAFLPEKEIQVCRKAYLSYTRSSDIFGAGVLAGTWGTFTGNSLELTPEQSALFGVATATAAGIGKELWDLSWRLTGDKSASFDFNDIAATTLGGVVGAGLSYAALKIFKKPAKIYGSVSKKEVRIGAVVPIR